MSFSRGNAEELLMRGMAAAKSGDPRDRAEAEYYLEWVLVTDADLDQQTDAWYWLSRVAEDPVRKRECLENVLAIRASHPDARRDLAILDGRLKPEDMRANPLQPGAAVVPGQQVNAGEVRRFKCPKCGASMAHSPGAGALRCQFCGTLIGEQGEVVQAAPPVGMGAAGEVSEQDWVAAIYTETGHKWVLPQHRVLECQGCGARVTFSPARVSTLCLYCGSPYVARVDAPDIDDLREPDGVVTFAFDAPAAAEHARAWFREQAEEGMAPDDLPNMAALAMPTPIYFPFWTFDMTGEVRWSGWIRGGAEIAGFSVSNGDNALRLGGAVLGIATGNLSLTAENLTGLAAQRLDRSDMVHTEGAVGVILDDILVPGTRSLPEEALLKLRYETGKAVPYSEDMLARWPAEVYSISLGDASLVARERAIEESNQQIALESGIVPGSSSSLMYDRTGLSVTSYKLLLVPVWTATYTYRSQPYHVLINGQSGQVEGELPKSFNPLSRIFGG